MPLNLDKDGLRSRVNDYDLFFIDIWGVLHNGLQIFEDSIEGLQGAVNSGIDAVGVRSSSSDKILKSAGAKETIKNFVNINFKLKKIGLSF